MADRRFAVPFQRHDIATHRVETCSVTSDSVRVDYVRAYLPKDETNRREDGEISTSYFLKELIRRLVFFSRSSTNPVASPDGRLHWRRTHNLAQNKTGSSVHSDEPFFLAYSFGNLNYYTQTNHVSPQFTVLASEVTKLLGVDREFLKSDTIVIRGGVLSGLRVLDSMIRNNPSNLMRVIPTKGARRHRRLFRN